MLNVSVLLVFGVRVLCPNSKYVNTLLSTSILNQLTTTLIGYAGMGPPLVGKNTRLGVDQNLVGRRFTGIWRCWHTHFIQRMMRGG